MGLSQRAGSVCSESSRSRNAAPSGHGGAAPRCGAHFEATMLLVASTGALSSCVLPAGGGPTRNHRNAKRARGETKTLATRPAGPVRLELTRGPVRVSAGTECEYGLRIYS